VDVQHPGAYLFARRLKMDPSQGISAEACARAYVAAIEGKYQGQTLDARKFV